MTMQIARVIEEEVEEVVEAYAQAVAQQQQVETEPEGVLTLGIETSCDETSVAVLRGEREVLANVVTSSSELHQRYGGVVPEIASREQVRAINPALAEALSQADVTFWDLSTVAVTVGPGLIGSLVVGVSSAKALASVLEIPLVAVNHLEAHLYANLLEHPKADIPAIGLIVSGGHTLIVHMIDHGIYDIVGQTLDDAAGEAFDKIARYLGLGFPGGPAIDEAAREGDPSAIPFPRPMLNEGYDLSFSGLKTAVINHVEKTKGVDRVEELAASFQEAVVDVLVQKTIRAAQDFSVPTIFLSGGVAANSRLRSSLDRACEEAEISLYHPSPQYCTDNAAMVACCGYHRYRRGVRTSLDVRPDPNLPLA